MLAVMAEWQMHRTVFALSYSYEHSPYRGRKKFDAPPKAAQHSARREHNDPTGAKLNQEALTFKGDIFPVQFEFKL